MIERGGRKGERGIVAVYPPAVRLGCDGAHRHTPTSSYGCTFEKTSNAAAILADWSCRLELLSERSEKPSAERLEVRAARAVPLLRRRSRLLAWRSRSDAETERVAAAPFSSLVVVAYAEQAGAL